MRASAEVHCQCTGVGFWWRAWAQAARSERSVSSSGMRRGRATKALSSLSAMWNQLPCLGWGGAPGAPPGLRRGKRLVQGTERVGVEVVGHQDHPIGLGVAGFQGAPQPVRPVDLGAPGMGLHMYLSRQGLHLQTDGRRAAAHMKWKCQPRPADGTAAASRKARDARTQLKSAGLLG